VFDPITGNFKANQFFGILDKFTQRKKPIRIIGDPDNQLPDKCSFTVLEKHMLAMRPSLCVSMKNKCFWWGKVRERDHLEGSDVDGRIILIWIFRKWDVGVWTGLIWRRTRTSDELL
jgi:hypothetical protein